MIIQVSLCSFQLTRIIHQPFSFSQISFFIMFQQCRTHAYTESCCCCMIQKHACSYTHTNTPLQLDIVCRFIHSLSLLISSFHCMHTKFFPSNIFHPIRSSVAFYAFQFHSIKFSEQFRAIYIAIAMRIMSKIKRKIKQNA